MTPKEKALQHAQRQWREQELKKVKCDPFIVAQNKRVDTLLDGKAQIIHQPVRTEKLMTPASVPKFVKWLTANGAEILSPTNQYEILRMRSERGVSIVYTNKARKITTITNDAKEAWRCYAMQLPWRAFPPTKRKRGSVDEETLRERDGHDCFFCCQPLEDDVTVEHLVARTHGGPNHISNKFLAHKDCNGKAGHLSAPEKIAIRVTAIHAKYVAFRVTTRLEDDCPF